MLSVTKSWSGQTKVGCGCVAELYVEFELFAKRSKSAFSPLWLRVISQSVLKANAGMTLKKPLTVLTNLYTKIIKARAGELVQICFSRQGRDFSWCINVVFFFFCPLFFHDSSKTTDIIHNVNRTPLRPFCFRGLYLRHYEFLRELLLTTGKCKTVEK